MGSGKCTASGSRRNLFGQVGPGGIRVDFLMFRFAKMSLNRWQSELDMEGGLVGFRSVRDVHAHPAPEPVVVLLR